MKPLDRSSPVPLYHQLATALRRRIEDGSMPPGTSLEPIRQAAERLGVNLHTVRHAYAELARQGLVESRRSAGTRVLERAPAPTPAAGRFEKEVRELCRRLELSPGELRERLDAWLQGEGGGVPVIHVLECSLAQAEDLASQLRARFAVDARPWELSRPGSPEEGALVGTFFHYNELRVRWPERLRAIRFLTIRPDPALPALLKESAGTKARRTSVHLCELDEPTLEAVAADLSPLLPEDRFRVRHSVTERPAELLRGRERAPVLFPPRAWSRLSDEEREHPRAVLVRYVFDPAELETLGHDLALPRRTRSTA